MSERPSPQLAISKQLPYSSRIWRVSPSSTGLPAGIVALILLWTQGPTSKVQWTLTVLIVGFWWGFAMALRERVILPLQTVSNLLAALQEGDYSIRGRAAGRDDPLGEGHARRSTHSARRCASSDWARSKRRLCCRMSCPKSKSPSSPLTESSDSGWSTAQGSGCCDRPIEHLLGRSASEIGIDDCLRTWRVRERPQKTFPGAVRADGACRRSIFREGGLPHQFW